MMMSVAKVNASGLTLDYCGYIGGSDGDGGLGSLLAVDDAGNAYVFGDTVSSQSSFPLAVGPDLGFNDGDSNAFVAKIAMEQGFSLDRERRVIDIKRGKTTTLEIHISRDPSFTDSITVKLQNADEKGIKLTPEERVSTTEGDDIKFKLKIKSGAERGTRRLFFTGRTASGIEHTSAVTINITK